MIELSEDQAAACEAIYAALSAGQTDLVLSGPAGSGKTTLMRYLISDLERRGWEVKLVAPTGKAAVRLSQTTGRDAGTIHSSLYRSMEKLYNSEGIECGVKFGDPKAIARGGGIVICDEASMVGSGLYADLRGKLPKDVPILCVGDREQLDPVMDIRGADFTHPTALLTTVHRQAELSPILRLATAIRQGEAWKDIEPDGAAYRIATSTVDDAAHWLADKRATGQDATLITFSNSLRHRINRTVRRARKQPSAVAPSDILACTYTHRGSGLRNGDLIQVLSVEPVAGSAGELVHVQLVGHAFAPVIAANRLACPFDQREWDRLKSVCKQLDSGRSDAERFRHGPLAGRLVRAEYGECLTAHKAQGSEWAAVGIVFDDMLAGAERRAPESFRKWIYTAVTRARAELVIFDVRSYGRE